MIEILNNICYYHAIIIFIQNLLSKKYDLIPTTSVIILPFLKVCEEINSNTDDDFHCPRHFIVSAVFQKYGVENANGRIYPEHVLKKEVERYMAKINEKRAIGELNHPSESVIDLSRVAMNIIELHWEGRTLVGKLELHLALENTALFQMKQTKPQIFF